MTMKNDNAVEVVHKMIMLPHAEAVGMGEANEIGDELPRETTCVGIETPSVGTRL